MSDALSAAEFELLQAMVDEWPTVDVEVVACFLGMSKGRAGRMMGRLERLGFLVAGARGAFALNRDAHAALPQRERFAGRSRHARAGYSS